MFESPALLPPQPAPPGLAAACHRSSASAEHGVWGLQQGRFPGALEPFRPARPADLQGRSTRAGLRSATATGAGRGRGGASVPHATTQAGDHAVRPEIQPEAGPRRGFRQGCRFRRHAPACMARLGPWHLACSLVLRSSTECVARAAAGWAPHCVYNYPQTGGLCGLS